MGLFSAINEIPFQKKVWIITGIVIFALLVTGIFIYTFNAFLLLIAGIVLAVYLRGLTSVIMKWTGWKELVCYIISILITLLLTVLLFWLIGARLQDQVDELQQKLPQMKKKALTIIKETPLLEKVAGKHTGFLQEDSTSADTSKGAAPVPAKGTQSPVMDSTTSSVDSASIPAPQPSRPDMQNSTQNSRGQSGQSAVMPILKNFFSSTFGFFGDMYTVLFLGLFLAATPREYVEGIVSLIPRKGRTKAKYILEQTGSNLRKWFKGMVLSVLITFALTAIGLLIWGVDLWLVLSITAGLLTFIPNFGPIIALVPAVMVGLLDSPETAIYIAILYTAVQMVESNLITPYIQKRMLDTPAALLLFFQMVMGVLSGGWGVVLATPLLVILMTLVQELYINRIGNQPENSGAQA